jgi:ribosome biogenesis GTPase
MEKNTMRHKGVVVQDHGRFSVVEIENQQLIDCVRKGRKQDVLVNDQVEILLTSENQGRIEQVVDRKNVVLRQDLFKTREIAANLDLVALVLSVQPLFNPEWVSRAISFCRYQQIDCVILLNKIDVTDHLPVARDLLRLFKQTHVSVIEVSATSPDFDLLATVQPLLVDRSSLLIGPSGAGKTSLLNRLLPDLQAATREFSEALNRGKHTTTYTRSYVLPPSFGVARLIDSPGFHEFGLKGIPMDQLAQTFDEFVPFLGECKFRNCLHKTELGCAVLPLKEKYPERYEHYLRCLQELTFFEEQRYR